MFNIWITFLSQVFVRFVVILIVIIASMVSFADSPAAGWDPGPSCFPEDLCKKHEEIRQKAVNLKDPEICGRIKERVYHQDYGVSARQQRQQCKVHYAIETGDVAYCKSFNKQPDYSGSRPDRDVCLSGLARRLKMPELCEDIYGMAEGKEREYYKELCLVQAADSLDICREYKTKKIVYYNVPQNFYAMCLHSVAENTNQPHVCMMIDDMNLKTQCQSYFEKAG